MNMNYRASLLISIMMLLSSCSLLSSNTKKPIINMPDRWHSHDTKTTLRPVQINTLAWWTKFHDPQLNQLIT